LFNLCNDWGYGRRHVAVDFTGIRFEQFEQLGAIECLLIRR